MSNKLCLTFLILGAVILAACGGEEKLQPAIPTFEQETASPNVSLDMRPAPLNVFKKYQGIEKKELAGITVDIDTLFEGYEEALIIEYQNFNLPEEITIEGGMPYVMVEATQGSGYEEYAEEILRLLLEDMLPEEIEFSTWARALYIDDEERRLYASINDNGYVTFSKLAGYEISFNDNFEVVDIIHVDRGESLEKSYLLADGEESLQDAVRYAEGWLNQKWVMIESEFTYRVKTIEVRRNEDCYFYDMTVEKFLRGIPLEDNSYVMLQLDENWHMQYVPDSMILRMCAFDSVDVFASGIGILTITETEEAEEGWLSLKDCMQILEQLFAEYMVYNISDIEIKYEIHPNIDEEDPYLRYTTVTMEPVWSFIIDIPKEDLLNEDGSFTAGNQRFYINVDMRTGEVWFDVG